MASNQGRLLSSIIKQAPMLGLSCPISEPLSVSASSLARRLICSSTHPQWPEQPDDSSKLRNEESGTREKIQNEEDQEEDEDDGVFVNKETGEVGGPRGPEPTRYGDWEQKGRCSDF